MDDNTFLRLLRAIVVLGLSSLAALTAVTAYLYQHCSILTFIGRCG